MRRFRLLCALAALVAFDATMGLALAGKADVVAVKVSRQTGGSYAFDVTIKSDDRGWNKYADKWEVLAPDGKVLGTRVLLHPHEDEQPFTRSLSGVRIPADVKAVKVRAHDKVEGFGGKEMTVTLPTK
jgi:hypothetical protein